jgi:hypothetical protein
VTGHEGANHDDDGRGLLEGEDERDKQGLEAIPIYIQKGSEEEKNWLRTHGRHKKVRNFSSKEAPLAFH